MKGRKQPANCKDKNAGINSLTTDIINDCANPHH